MPSLARFDRSNSSCLRASSASFASAFFVLLSISNSARFATTWSWYALVSFATASAELFIDCEIVLSLESSRSVRPLIPVMLLRQSLITLALRFAASPMLSMPSIDFVARPNEATASEADFIAPVVSFMVLAWSALRPHLESALGPPDLDSLVSSLIAAIIALSESVIFLTLAVAAFTSASSTRFTTSTVYFSSAIAPQR